MWEQINGARSKTRYRGVSAAGERLQTCLKRTKIMYVDLQQFATLFLPQESAVFYPDGNSPGKNLENSGK